MSGQPIGGQPFSKAEHYRDTLTQKLVGGLSVAPGLSADWSVTDEATAFDMLINRLEARQQSADAGRCYREELELLKQARGWETRRLQGDVG